MTDVGGNAAQVRIVAEQVAEAAVTRFASEYPMVAPKAEVPPPLKWAATIIAGLFTMASGAMALWLVTTVNEMQVTLARMDERMANQSEQGGRAVEELDRRVTRLERFQEQTSGVSK